ncbi:hypothetical protein BG015_004496 [Linnemannia schmuckeri]|uniref:C2H2-type domain-containing protein n=1 Tax=Linnemannia schmuckeri TaxID=64567 RepID=A0A9P5VD19_9FUNG|nr:hypothetical protein BG015_004496 [Linnemannia schmuckeri]
MSLFIPESAHFSARNQDVTPASAEKHISQSIKKVNTAASGNLSAHSQNAPKRSGMLHTKINHKTTQCNICGKAILKRNLSAHMKIHDASRPEVPCTVEGCQKVFSTERTLATHIKTSHPSSSGTPQFKCEYEDCGQAFSFKHVLERHIRNRHTNPQTKRKKRNDALEFDVIDALAGFDDEDEAAKLPFACQVPGSGCNRRFTTEALLKRHLKSRMHMSGEVTGLAVLRAMEQDENRTIQDMIALHLDASNSSSNLNSPSNNSA